MNGQIRARQVRLIDSNGTQLGIVALEEALERAKTQELDLVEVSPDAEPPVCKIMDYQRQIFEQKRRQKESRKKTKNVELKEIRMRPKIDPHDYGIKLNHVKEFLEKGHKVKVTMRYRGLEMRHYEIGTQILERVAADLAEIAEVDAGSHRKDAARIQSLVISPKKTK